MSPQRGDLADTNPLQQNTSFSKSLADSRWAPGGFEDQRTSNHKMATDQTPNNKATTAPATGAYSSRRTTGPAEKIQTQHKKKTRVNQERSQKATEKKHVNLAPSQPSLGTDNYEASSTPKTMATPRRIIGPLSDGQKALNVENPFFNPEKQKDLSGSLWANNYEPFFATQTTATPRRIIGELSEEEKAVKMENPFFDPKKHKGLGSSRWA